MAKLWQPSTCGAIKYQVKKEKNKERESVYVREGGKIAC